MSMVYCEAHTPALEAASQSGIHAEVPGCVWPHDVAPSGPLPTLGHPLRSCD